MAVESNRRAIERFYNQMWNRWDLAVADELLAENITFRGSFGVVLQGLDRFKAYVGAVQRAFPDFHNQIDQLIAVDDQVVARLTSSGTHHGEVFGIAPTGAVITYPGIAIFRFAAGKIVDGWVVGDTLSVARQLGGFPPA